VRLRRANLVSGLANASLPILLVASTSPARTNPSIPVRAGHPRLLLRPIKIFEVARVSVVANFRHGGGGGRNEIDMAGGGDYVKVRCDSGLSPDERSRGCAPR